MEFGAAVGTTTAAICNPDSFRVRMLIRNLGPSTVLLGYGPNLTAANAVVSVPKNGTVEEDTQSVIYAVVASGSAILQIHVERRPNETFQNMTLNTSIMSAANAPGSITAVKTSAYTASEYDGLIPVDATSGAITVTLPLAASTPKGTTISVIKKDSSGNAVTVSRTGAPDTINGANTKVLAAQGNAGNFTSDGVSNWYAH